MVEIKHEDWIKEAMERYPDKNIRFVCPSCGYKQSVSDYKEAGASEGVMGFSCIGRLKPDADEAFGGSKNGGPCNYAGGGLIGLNPIRVVFDDGSSHDFFDFADMPLSEGAK
jgi:hypothetical protein